MKDFEFLEHTADIKIRVYGNTIGKIFEHAVLAFSSYVGRGKKISSNKGKIITVSGNDSESLLYNFLDELIYLVDAENFIAAKASVTLRGYNLKAELYGDDTKNYKDLDAIKAATYAEMYIKKVKSEDKSSKQDENWEAQFVLDV